MAYTIPEKIEIGDISTYLVQNAIAKGSLFSPELDPRWGLMLAMETDAIRWQYAFYPTDPTLQATSDYLYSICYRAPQAANIMNSANGGIIPPVVPGGVPAGIYPFIITQADFEPDGISYNNPDIVGDNISIFVNEYAQQWLVAGPLTFSYTLTGIQMNIPLFDANSQSWTIMIQKLLS